MIIGYPETMGTGGRDAYPFNALFDGAMQVTPTQVQEGAVQALVIWGGEDISPSLYNAEVSRRTHAREALSRRDRVEVDLFNAAVEKGIPILGICRGAQLVCALSGGTLIQDVHGHHGDHAMITDTGRSISTTSIHHQMMFPYDLQAEEYRLLAWAHEPLSGIYVVTDDNILPTLGYPEPEVVYFRTTNALAIQGHPEFDSPNSDFVNYTLSLTSKLLKGTL